MEEGKMDTEERGLDIGGLTTNRREFLAGLAALGVAGWAERAIGATTGTTGWSGLPDRPQEQPLDFHALANAFDAYVMNPVHGTNLRAKDGRQVFPSALEGAEDGGLTTYGPMALGKELRGEGLEELAASLKATSASPMGSFSMAPGLRSASTGI
jgi:hypothetical protein